jgi:hypothetical protein
MAIWPFGNRQRTSIRVQLVDVSGGVKFPLSSFPLEKLPASFESQTTLHLKNDDWEVVEARPATAEEYRKSGKLVLLVRKLNLTKFSSPDEILFSLPTISNELPKIQEGSSKLGRDVLELHEDDWRQVEWVTDSLTEAIEKELESIREVYDRNGAELALENGRVGMAFKKVHVRERIPVPMQSTQVALSDLLAAAGPRATILDGVSWMGVAGLTADAFAVRLISSIEIYGLSRGGRVEVACFHNRRVNNVPTEDVHNIATFARANGLVLIDWCRMIKVECEDYMYREYFVRDSNIS